MVAWLACIENRDAVRVKIWISRAIDMTIKAGAEEILPDLNLNYYMDASA